MSEPKPPKCATCRTTVNVHPWGTLHEDSEGREHWSYVWRCGPCQYELEHPDAAQLPAKHRKPKLPQSESLLDVIE